MDQLRSLCHVVETSTRLLLALAAKLAAMDRKRGTLERQVLYGAFSGESNSPRFYHFCVRQFMPFFSFSVSFSSLFVLYLNLGISSCIGDVNKYKKKTKERKWGCKRGWKRENCMNCFAQKWQNLGLLASSHGAFVVFLRCLFVLRFVQCFFVTDFSTCFFGLFFWLSLEFFFL